MTEPSLEQVWEVKVPAPPAEVWEALTLPQQTIRYYFGAPVHSDWRAGSTIAYGDPAQPAATGTVLEADRARRLRLRIKLLINDGCRADPPHRLTWDLEPLESGTRVRLTIDEYPSETTTYQVNAQAMGRVIRGLEVVLDADAQAGLGRVDRIEACRVLELTPERLPDFQTLFDHHAFSDNPAWGDCYCMCDRFAGSAEEWGVRSGEQNRSDMSELIVRRRAHGLLAYVDGDPVGWCSVAPGAALPGLRRDAELGIEFGQALGVINCFVISSRYRGHGVAGQLLDAACGLLADRGCEVAEAYPAREAGSPAHEFRGPLSLYLGAGFKPHREAGRHVVVRKQLGRAAAAPA